MFGFDFCWGLQRQSAAARVATATKREVEMISPPSHFCVSMSIVYQTTSSRRSTSSLMVSLWARWRRALVYGPDRQQGGCWCSDNGPIRRDQMQTSFLQNHLFIICMNKKSPQEQGTQSVTAEGDIEWITVGIHIISNILRNTSQAVLFRIHQIQMNPLQAWLCWRGSNFSSRKRIKTELWSGSDDQVIKV